MIPIIGATGLPLVVSENMAYLDTFDSPIGMRGDADVWIKLTPLETWVRSYFVSMGA